MSITSSIRLVVALSLLCFVGATEISAATQSEIMSKVDQVKKELKKYHAAGGDPAPFVKRMDKVKGQIQKGNLEKADTLLDGVLADLTGEAQTEVGVNREWRNPELIEIVGYKKDAMEIGISKDETTLLFNDREKPNKDLHWAKRIDDRRFEYMGKIENVNTFTVDASPVLDDNNRIYYTSTYKHDRLKKNGNYTSMYVGDFVNGAVKNPQPLAGDIYVRNRMWFSLDTDVSPDGDTIYYSVGHFDTSPPSSFDVAVARRVSGNEYKVVDGWLDNVNTEESHEYAPSISADGRELYFTRVKWVGKKATGNGIYVARRDSPNEPFGPPEKIEVITGVVEAPTISEDGKTIYYHKKDGKRFKVYRVTRD